MATQDSTNAPEPKKSYAQKIFDAIKERDEQAYAMVKAIKLQLREDVNPEFHGMTSVTEHLLNVLDEILTDHSAFYALEKELPKYRREVQA